MSFTLKEIYNAVRTDIPAIAPYDVYKYWNLACDELSDKNFLQENLNNVAVTSDGIIDLTTITNGVKQIITVFDPKGYRMKSVGGNREYIERISKRGERRYAMIGENIYTKPPYFETNLDNTIVTDLLKFVATVARAGGQIEYQGDLDSFWEEHGIIKGSTLVITGTDSNNFTLTVGSIENEVKAGTHTGSEDVKTLEDENATFSLDGSLIGKTIYNYTSRGSGVIISNTATTIYAEMDSDYRDEWWMNGDRYEVIIREKSVLLNTSEDHIVDEGSGVMTTVTPSSYIYQVLCYEGIPKFTTFSVSSSISLNNYLLPIVLHYIKFLANKAFGNNDLAKLALEMYMNSLKDVMSLRGMIKEGEK